jgi:hypothetical protein
MAIKRVLMIVAAGCLAALSIVAVGASPAGAAVQHFGRPMVRAGAGTQSTTISLNWSGYAVTSKKGFTYVHSTFVQPAITCTGDKNQWTSNWVGLDGYTSSTVEQDGTFAHCGGSDGTKAVYEAWYEMYPAGSVSVFKVNPGDIIDTAVTYNASGDFVLTVADLSTGKSATDTATCAECGRTSAEWIIERPELCNNAGTKCFISELADFDTSTMQGDQAQLAGGKVKGVGGFTNYPIDMVDPAEGGGFISLDTVGPLSGKSFTATWDRSGNIYPV